MNPARTDPSSDTYKGKKLLLAAMALGLLTHGIIVYFTMPKTYDAFVHIFFADHYARFWFEPWEYRWYTGFLTTSYPPLVHQMIALISKLFPLKVAFSIYAIVILQVLIVGIYRFSKLFFDKTTAGIAAIVVVLLSSIVQTLHVYGQMPTLTGISFLLNSLPFLYQAIVKRKPIYFVMALAFIAVVVSAHHVTAIFGMVFFIAPTIFMALADKLSPDAKQLGIVKYFIEIILKAFKDYRAIIIIGAGIIILAVGLIFPYWYWSKTDPIAQVSIPHGSRDNFFEKPSSGLMFYIIPLLLIFALLPAISYSITKYKRLLAWAVSFFLCLLFGSGGTTPLPRLMLGNNAFDILTLDRFGFWASIISIPFIAKFIHDFLIGRIKDFWHRHFTAQSHFVLSGITGVVYLLFLIFVFHLGTFRPLQPKEVEIQPILNFLNRDNHMQWRYLTLGFGDQMAWLSANSLAATVDGNYHSARRLPELTTRPVERLENAKYSGNEGLASLRDFLTNAEKYSLKYVFSNDRYYDPLLYFLGWSRTIRLENGIMVWEKGNISTIKPVTPKPVPDFLKKAWGILPVSSLILAVLLTIIYLRKYKEENYTSFSLVSNETYPLYVIYASSFLPVILFSMFISMQIYELLLVKEQKDPRTAVINFYNHLDFQEFEKAFHFFKPSPLYTLDQYLLEKSVTDGGLLPSYAKLDSINTTTISEKKDTASLAVFTRWRTSLGFKNQKDTLQLTKMHNKWYIIPKSFEPEIPDEQVRSYQYTVFKKQGKRVISSFPTVKDDRITKPFAAFTQANLVKNGNSYAICGEILNADDVPVNFALKATLLFKDNIKKDYYAGELFKHNLSPKESSFFQIDMTESADSIDRLGLISVELYAETDVSEKGYLQAGQLSFSTKLNAGNNVEIDASIFNDLTTDINIPSLLIAEKDLQGNIWQVGNHVHNTAIRSGMNRAFKFNFSKIQDKAQIQNIVPLKLFINGQGRNSIKVSPDLDANKANGVSIKGNGFLSQEIYLQ